MLQPLDIMFDSATPVAPPTRTWASIPRFLDAEVQAGHSRSSRTKIRSAVNTLLKVVGTSPENAPIDLAWFDRTFPEKGWDPTTMDIEKGTYNDYRNRVRPLIERMIGASAVKKALRSVEDDWKACGTYLGGLEEFSGLKAKRLIPLKSTLTNAARRAGLRTVDVDNATLLEMHAEEKKGAKDSLVRVSKLIAGLQATTAGILAWFPHPITPIEPESLRRYEVPPQLRTEIEDIVEKAAQKKYIRVKNKYEYVSEGTRINYRTTMHAAIDALLTVGRLRRNANGFASILEDPEALDDLVNHMVSRVEDGDITARHATSLMARLPVILDRNGIDSGHLRAAIKDVDELRHDAKKAGMPVSAMRLCRKLIESRSYRNKFLLAHAKPRLVAQSILDAAHGRALTDEERRLAVSHGVVALFCAIEAGGAPIRVENFLECLYGVPTAWATREGTGFGFVIPAEKVKNKKAIRFKMKPNMHKWCDTVAWYLDHIRPLLLPKDPETGEVLPCRWLVPMLSDPSRHCPYETFHGWFVRIMRDVVGVPCLPHNYRHGKASMLYHRYPHRLAHIAQQLGDTEATVVGSYAWVHQEKAMEEGQQLVCDLIET
jgi:hypothetical protein